MKLDFPTVEVETSGKFKQATFGIGDERVIFNILRKKMYSRPIYVICQEIMSNSRDANREMGRGHVPVEVILPNKWSDQIQFKDNGRGITPDRMENVYLKYGNSTKRDDNSQTGGFGLGAKTPFAYTETFNIITTTTEPDGKNKKRTYIAYVDTTQLGCVSLVSEQDTDEPTGTIISFAINQPEDRKEFIDAILNVGYFWEPRPEIKGDDRFKWNTRENLAEGNGWVVTRMQSCPAITGAALCIDGIPYNLRLNALFPTNHAIQKDPDYYIMESIAQSHKTVLFFKVGELSVTANREDLDYQPEVIEKVHNRLRDMINEARTTISDRIKTAPNLWEASIEWNGASSVFSSFGIIPRWNNMNLIGTKIDIYSMGDYDWQTRTQYFSPGDDAKVSVFERDPNDSSGVGVQLAKEGYRRKSVIRRIAVQKDWKVVEDLSTMDKPDRSRVMTIMGMNPSVKYVAVVNMTQKGKDYLNKKLNWDSLGFESLDKYIKTKRTRVAHAGGYKIWKVKKLGKKPGSRTYEWISDHGKSTADATGGVYVVIKGDNLFMSDGRKITKDRIIEIQNVYGIVVHGFLSKWAKKDINPAWRPLWDVLKEKADALLAQPEVSHHILYGGEGSMYDMLDYSIVDALDASKIEDGIFKTWLVNSKKFKKDEAKISEVNRALRLMDKGPLEPSKILKWTMRRSLDRYPLLRHINKHQGKMGKRMPHDLMAYVNLIETKKETENASC